MSTELNLTISRSSEMPSTLVPRDPQLHTPNPIRQGSSFFRSNLHKPSQVLFLSAAYNA